MEITEIRDRIEIDALGAGGEGLGGGYAVAQTLPGDVLADGAIETASPHRVAPACAHFGDCGGCMLQHGSDAFLADWKTDLVRTALRAQDLPDAVRHVHVSPAKARRRVVLSGRRTKKTVQLGFFERRGTRLIPISECHLIAPEIWAAFDVLKPIVRLAATRTSVVKLTVTSSEAGLDVSVTEARDLDRAGLQDLARISGEFARVAWNGEVVLLARPPIQRFGQAHVVPPPGAFLQATADGEAALRQAVLGGLEGQLRVVDLFAGCGTFALPLAQQADIWAVEYEPAMREALEQGWRKATGLKHVRAEARDLFRRPVLAQEFKGWDAAVIDPPRAGAEAQTREIAGSDLAHVVSVSCNPVTFARDARVLQDAGFKLKWLDVVDQFKWSTHVELVGLFQR